MLKGKNLWIALGVGAVAYYLWMQNKKKQAVSAPAAATNFTGDLDVPQYQNASGRYVRKKLQFGAPAGQYGNEALLYSPLGR
jgi:uncharacterized protein HemX